MTHQASIASRLHPRGLLVVGGIVIEASLLLMYLSDDVATDMGLFILVHSLVVAILGLLVYRFHLDEGQGSNLTLILIVGFGVLFRTTLLFHPVVASDDVYRYVWDGRVSLHGTNPFLYSPADPSLDSLRTEHLPSLVNHPAMRTIYPPLAQQLFLLSNAVFGPSIVGLKSLLILIDIGNIFVILSLLRALHRQGYLIILYAWSPLPIFYFALDGHVDALGIMFFLLFLLLCVTRRPIIASVALGGAALAKVLPLIAVPFLLRENQVSAGKRVLILFIPVLLFAAGCWFYLEPTGGLFESFTIFSHTFEFNGSAFTAIFRLTASQEYARTICTALFAGWILWIFIRSGDIIGRVFLSFVGFVIFSPIVHPWYFCWLAALLPLRWSGAVFLLLALSATSNLVVLDFHRTGVWKSLDWVLLLEYLPFYALFFLEVFRGGILKSKELIT